MHLGRRERLVRVFKANLTSAKERSFHMEDAWIKTQRLKETWCFLSIVKCLAWLKLKVRLRKVGVNWQESDCEWSHVPLWRCWTRSCRPAVPNLFGFRDRCHGRQFFHGLGWGDGFGMIQAHYIYCALSFYYYYIVIYSEIIIQLIIRLTGGGDQVVMWAMGSGCKYRWSFAHLPAAHLLLCSLVPNRP